MAQKAEIRRAISSYANNRCRADRIGAASITPKRNRSASGFANHQQLLQLRVLGLGLLQDGDVGVSVFPQRQEILIRGAGLTVVALHRHGSADLKMGKCSNRRVEDDSAMVENFLKLLCRFRTTVPHQICLAPEVGRHELGLRPAQF